MMKTIIVVSQVSFQLGHVTLLLFAAHLAEELRAADAARAARAIPCPPRITVFFVASAIRLLFILTQSGRSGGTRTHGLRFWRPPLYQLSYTPSADRVGSRARIPYLMILATTPEPTVRPPSRMAKRSFSSIAIGTISSTSIDTLSPGITISVPSGSFTMPVTSVVRK